MSGSQRHWHWAWGVLAPTVALLYLLVCIAPVNEIPSSLRRAIPAFTCGSGAALPENGNRRFMPRKTLMYQAADKLYWPQMQATHALHSAYAAAHNYTLVITDSPEPGLPAGRVNLNRIWRTIAEAAADQYDVLVWLDSDAVIVTRQPIELITRGSPPMFATRAAPGPTGTSTTACSSSSCATHGSRS